MQLSGGTATWDEITERSYIQVDDPDVADTMPGAGSAPRIDKQIDRSAAANISTHAAWDRYLYNAFGIIIGSLAPCMWCTLLCPCSVDADWCLLPDAVPDAVPDGV